MKKRVCLYTKPFPEITSYRQMIDLAAEYGIDGVEGFCFMEFAEPDAEAAKEIRAYADSKGVVFPCFSVYINLVGNDTDKMVQKLKGYADVASILGSPFLHHTIACEFANPDNILPRKEELFEKGVCAVRQVYDYCETIGIKAIYEEQGYLFNGVEGFGRFLSEVDRDIRMVADFGNIYQAGDTPEEFFSAFADKFVHAHIKDVTITDTNATGEGLLTLSDKYMNQAVVGKGEVAISSCVDILEKSGFEGYYGVEYGAVSKAEFDKVMEFVLSVCD